MGQAVSEATLSLDGTLVFFEGAWTLAGLGEVHALIEKTHWPANQKIVIQGARLKALDSAGACALYRCVRALQSLGNTLSYDGFLPVHQSLLSCIDKQSRLFTKGSATVRVPPLFYRVGRETVKKWIQSRDFMTLIGEVSIRLGLALQNVKGFQWTSMTTALEHAGYRALPILGLLSFLIGIVLTYQMGLQLESYGANIYIVYLSGMAIFREFAPLMTAVIVAGRTGASFTAEIATMKVNEEVDALSTLGLSPVEYLVLPKIIALLIAAPLLILWSDLFGMLGSLVMSQWMLKIPYLDFIHRLKEDVGLTQYLIGLAKAPVFAFIIASVGCFQGLLVSSSAGSVGIQTTKSVVQAIFLIIIADAIFSVILSWMGV